MRATDFEVRNETLLHLLVVGLAFLTYAFQPDDIVWALVKRHSDPALLERIVFSAGTLMIFASAAFQTWTRAYWQPDSKALMAPGWNKQQDGFHLLYLGRIIFALGIGLLAPAFGTAILLVGEGILILRLHNRDRGDTAASNLDPHLASVLFSKDSPRNWTEALRRESSKWGLAFTMVVFTFTLKDRLAEILAGISFLLWIALNVPDFIRSRRNSGNA